jgi:hypothetical protein
VLIVFRQANLSGVRAARQGPPARGSSAPR